MKPPAKQSKAKRRPGRASPVGPAGAHGSDVPLSLSRRWLFRLVAVVILPLVLLGGIEAVLRLAGYGHSTNLFNRLQINQQAFLVNNDAFAFRFFPPQTARFPGPVRMAAQKSPGTYRTFILGESAAMGDPEPAYGASRYLEALLSERYPKTHFEIVNLGFTAINSHVILPIARECARQNGDLWIIYMGNNEMVGPFGAATVFGAKAPPLGYVRLNLAIQKTRLGQLLMNFSRKLKGGNANAPSWGGMEMFVGNQIHADDPRKQIAYQNFSRNLHDIVQVGLDSGAKIVLNTVAVNLKDCAPFATLVDTNLPKADRAQYEQLFRGGVQSREQGDFIAASQKFESASRLDPTAAELQFRWGENLLQLKSFAAAREHLQLACDDDALPFRADSRINAIIRKEQAGAGGNQLVLCDAAAALAAETPENLCGKETFLEHVHFTFDGNYRLGRIWAEKVSAMMPAAITNQAAGDWVNQETCEHRLGLSDWNRSLVIQSMVDRLEQPPLNGQLNNATRVKEFQDRIQLLHARMSDDAKSKTRQEFLKALAQSPDDYYLHENFTLFLESVGDFAGAVAECHRVKELIPQDCVLDFQLGRLLQMQGRFAEAESSFREAVAIRPSLTDGWVQLGNALAMENKFEAALASYKTALTQRPQDSQAIFNSGKILAKMNRHAEAIEHYRAAIKLNPANWEPHFELGGELDTANQLAEACVEFAAAAQLNPNSSRTHFNYGVLLAKQSRLAAAQHEFVEALRIEPGYQNAQLALTKVQQLKESLSKE